MRKTKRYLIAALAILMVVTACKISFGGDEQDEQSAIQTAIAATLTASGAQTAATMTVEPTATTEPEDTAVAVPTKTPLPCNAAYFVSETVPDGTDFNPGETFTKTWRLKNIGTCTWNTNYKLKFGSGDQMNGPSSQKLANSVGPNEQIDIAVDLKAPTTPKSYKGIWQIVDDEGRVFVYNIWVAIDVVEPAAASKPDLVITEFSINPPTPVMGENAHVRVRARNQGGADSAGFKMEWYGLSTFANPSCSWNITGGLAAGSSVLMECDFVFNSWYPVNKTSIVFVDVNDSVDESDEGNNSASISPFGVSAP
jgi:hypothetical protein